LGYLAGCRPLSTALERDNEGHALELFDAVAQRGVEHPPLPYRMAIRIGSISPLPFLSVGDMAVANTVTSFAGPRSDYKVRRASA